MNTEKKEKKNNRVLGLDIIRAIAIFCVIGHHFFFYTGFYSTNVLGNCMTLQVFLRAFFLIAVPLFIMLIGYFSKDTKYTKNFFKKLIGILTLYVLYVLLEYVVIFEGFNAGDFINKLLNFDISAYMWYVEMYIGLYLLTPFLNILYNNLDEKMKKYLLILLICFTTLPSTINNKFIVGISLPEFWVVLYPLTFFYLGKYIKEFKPKFNKFYLTTTLILVLLVQTIFEVGQADSSIYASFLTFRNSFFVMLCAILTFLIFYDVNSEKKILNKVFACISVTTFDMYLVSRTVQYYIYPYFLNLDIPSYRAIIYLFPAVILVFIVSLIVGVLRRKLIKTWYG